jgi:hypothetical protein
MKMAMYMIRGLALTVIAVATTLAYGQNTAATSAPAKMDVAAEPRKLQIANKPWTGDFDKMLERRVIRIYAPFSRSLYYSDKGRERGIAVELARD